MKKEFEMSMFGAIKFFVGLQEDSRLVWTPMVTGYRLSKIDDFDELN